MIIKLFMKSCKLNSYMTFGGRLYCCSANIYSLCHTSNLPLKDGHSCPLNDGLNDLFWLIGL